MNHKVLSNPSNLFLTMMHLSLDLSKAFERINPYWILQILSARKAPWWIIMYTRHILLFRRCRHKVQGKLLPSKMIVTGVDMGRSFSVLLFCVAMDPVLTYLNRIPGMLAVQGYVDDTTMVGDTTAGMQWLSDAWQVCTRLRSAGIQIDEHHCWRTSGRSEERRVGKECRSRWSPYH